MVIYYNTKRNFNEVPRLLDLMKTSGYEIVQNNGQRKYGPPPSWTGSPPAKGSEVFVGKLPRDCFEDEIVPFMEQAGRIYEMRLMMDFSGSNRGYAFVMYTNPEDAARAVVELNNQEIREGHPLGVVKSGNNCRLFVGGLPKVKTKEEVKQALSEIVEGISDVILYSSPADKSKNRGFAFVEFFSHREAAMARRKLLCHKTKIWGKCLAVDWAEPEIEVNDEVMSKVRILYVRNLLLETTEMQLWQFFEERNGEGIVRVKKIRDFAFVHFQLREAAEKCLAETNGQILGGCKLEVTWAKPVNRIYFRIKKEYLRRNHGQRHFSFASQLPDGNMPVPLTPLNSPRSLSKQKAPDTRGNMPGEMLYFGAENFHSPPLANRMLVPVPRTHELGFPYCPMGAPGTGERPRYHFPYGSPNPVLPSGVPHNVLCFPREPRFPAV